MGGPRLTKEKRQERDKAQKERTSALKELERITGYKWKRLTKRGHELLNDSKKRDVIQPTTDKKNVPESKATKGKSLYRIDFDMTREFKVGGGYFFCEVLNLPKQDEACILQCEIENCPFHGVGYFRSKGIKF